METLPTVKDLLEAGAHFGHQTKRWNPKMVDYIFAEKNDIHIIDLYKTVEKLGEALAFIESVTANGGEPLFVGTKRQAQEVVEEVAKRDHIQYVTNRWVGGLLTNFTITKKNINNMLDIEDKMVKGFENRTKQEIILIGKELERLQRLYGGIRDMNKRPGVIVLVDPKHERIAINEAHKLGIPLVAVVDTNCDPDEVTYPIPANDDAIKSITLFFELFAQAVSNGRGQHAAKVKAQEEKKHVQGQARIMVKTAKAEAPKKVAKPVVETKPEIKKEEKAVEKPVKKTVKKVVKKAEK